MPFVSCLVRWSRYGDGTARVTVESNVLFPNIPEDRLEDMQQVKTPPLYLPRCNLCFWLDFLQTGLLLSLLAVLRPT